MVVLSVVMMMMLSVMMIDGADAECSGDGGGAECSGGDYDSGAEVVIKADVKSISIL